MVLTTQKRMKRDISYLRAAVMVSKYLRGGIAAVAESSGLGRTSLHHFLRCSRDPNYSTLVKLDDFFVANPLTPSQIVLHAEWQKIFNAVQALPIHLRRAELARLTFKAQLDSTAGSTKQGQN